MTRAISGSPARTGGPRLSNHAVTPQPGKDRPAFVVRLAFWIAATVIGAVYAWASRHAMNSDGICYLDMGDAYLRGDWAMAINAYWSPFYSWLLGLANLVFQPSAFWEFAVAHFVNLAAYLGALGSFDFLLRQLLRYGRLRAAKASASAEAGLPDWAIMAIGYTLFIYFTTAYITLWLVTPDLIVSAMVYLACGLLLRIRLDGPGNANCALLGLVLGVGYLSKAAMFVLAFVFLILGLLAHGGRRNVRKSIRYVAVAFSVFLLVSAPLIGALSVRKGRLTFGDSGKLNYAWYVNWVPRYIHWQGDPPGNGAPVHPTRKIFDSPRAYEFGSPIGGTYPAWYDPSYWYDGVRSRVDATELVRVLGINLKIFGQLFVKTQLFLATGAAILIVIGRRRSILSGAQDLGVLLVPALAGLALYSIATILQDPRYLAPFLVIFWLTIFAATRFRRDRMLVQAASLVAVSMLALQLASAPPAMHNLYPPASVLRTTAVMLVDEVRGREAFFDYSRQAAEALKQEGIRRGDKVAVIGDSFTQFWARLARVQIVAELPSVAAMPDVGGDQDFWRADDAVKSKVLEALRRTGARIVVTPADSQDMVTYLGLLGWHPLGTSNLYAYDLQK